MVDDEDIKKSKKERKRKNKVDEKCHKIWRQHDKNHFKINDFQRT